MCEIGLHPQEPGNLYVVFPDLSENSQGFYSASLTPGPNGLKCNQDTGSMKVACGVNVWELPDNLLFSPSMTLFGCISVSRKHLKQFI